MITNNQIREALSEGQTVTINPRGNSMRPRIKSKDPVELIAATVDTVAVGDVVFCKVKGRYMVHLVTAIKDGKVQISNNHGHVNGWTRTVFGKAVNV